MYNALWKYPDQSKDWIQQYLEVSKVSINKHEGAMEGKEVIEIWPHRLAV